MSLLLVKSSNLAAVFISRSSLECHMSYLHPVKEKVAQQCDQTKQRIKSKKMVFLKNVRILRSFNNCDYVKINSPKYSQMWIFKKWT